MMPSVFFSKLPRIQTKIPLSTWKSVLLKNEQFTHQKLKLSNSAINQLVNNTIKQQKMNCSTDAAKDNEPFSSNATEEETFSSLMRNCKFTQMGDPVGRVVVGRIYHVVDEDLYIDFGHKFPCVCQCPRYR